MPKFQIEIEGAYIVAGCGVKPYVQNRVQGILGIQIGRPLCPVPPEAMGDGSGIALHIRTDGLKEELEYFAPLTGPELELHGGNQARTVLLLAAKLSEAYRALEAANGKADNAVEEQDHVG